MSEAKFLPLIPFLLSILVTLFVFSCGLDTQEVDGTCGNLKFLSRYLLALFFVLAGVLHFVPSLIKSVYMPIMPPALPFKLMLIYISGVVEIFFGALLIVPEYIEIAALGIILTLIAVFPANIYLAMSEKSQRGAKVTRSFAIIRLPFQLLFLIWAYWFLY